jgi:hypothetical protein
MSQCLSAPAVGVSPGKLSIEAHGLIKIGGHVYDQLGDYDRALADIDNPSCFARRETRLSQMSVDVRNTTGRPCIDVTSFLSAFTRTPGLIAGEVLSYRDMGGSSACSTSHASSASTARATVAGSSSESGIRSLSLASNRPPSGEP